MVFTYFSGLLFFGRQSPRASIHLNENTFDIVENDNRESLIYVTVLKQPKENECMFGASPTSAKSGLLPTSLVFTSASRSDYSGKQFCGDRDRTGSFFENLTNTRAALVG